MLQSCIFHSVIFSFLKIDGKKESKERRESERKREREKSDRDRDGNTMVPGMLNTLEDLQRRQRKLSTQNGKENTQFSLMEH